MKALKLFALAMLLGSTLCSLGCARTVTLYPITEQDIKCDEKGCWMSTFYMEEVLKARMK
jgi:hypothetical protein